MKKPVNYVFIIAIVGVLVVDIFNQEQMLTAIESFTLIGLVLIVTNQLEQGL